MGVDGERGVRNRLQQVQLPYLEYLNGQTLSAPDNTALTIPYTASCVEIAAEGGAVYWNIGGVATANAPGYIPEDGREWIGPCCRDTLQAQGIRVLSSGTVHVMYFREN